MSLAWFNLLKKSFSCNSHFFLMDHLPVMFVGLQAGQNQNWVFLFSLVWLPILVQTLCWILVRKISWHSCSSLLPLVPQIFMLYSKVPCVSYISRRACQFFKDQLDQPMHHQGWGWFNLFML